MTAGDGTVVRVRWADGLDEERRLSRQLTAAEAAHAKWLVLCRHEGGAESVLRRVGSRWIEDVSCTYTGTQLVQATGWPAD